MIILNAHSKKRLSSNASYCTSIFSKAIGLMFSWDKNKSLLFEFTKEEKICLHMWFVFYPIDVVFLDSKKKVVELKEHFLPFTAYCSHHKARYALEVPQGTIQRTKTKIGDFLSFKQ